VEILANIIVSGLGLIYFLWRVDKDPPEHRTGLRLGVVAHVVFPQILWWIANDRNEGDQFMFYGLGQDLLDGFNYDPDRYGPEILQHLTGESTSFMIGCAAVLLAVVAYPTAANVVVSFFALAGQLMLYRGLREHLPKEQQGAAVIACLLVPSASFWTSGLVKEAFAFAGLGMAILGASRVVSGSTQRGVALIVLGALITARAKAYVLYPLFAAIAVWWMWARQSETQRSAILARPGRLVALLLVAALGFVLLNYFFPRFSPQEFGQEASRMRLLARSAGGGSVFALSSEETVDESLTGQLTLAPIGVLNALFRPLPFDVRNAIMVPAAIESTVILFMFGRVVFGPGMRVALARTFASPMLLGSAVMVLLFSVAVGLTTLNFGTLSRYRTPMLPFLVLWLLQVARRDAVLAPHGRAGSSIRRVPKPAISEP
jgi:hypothetical protein